MRMRAEAAPPLVTILCMEGAGEPLGVIDIGSNSGRVLVARVLGAAHLDVLGDARSSLRLVREVARTGQLSHETIDGTLRIVKGFLAVANSSGAERIIALATAAVREASNGEDFIQRTRHELGVPIQIADGDEEARFGFLGAVHGLPVQDGIVLDVGGGSLQLIHFRDRKLERSWSLSLGALRLSDRFLKSDPPTRGEMRALKEHVYARLENAGIRPLQGDERMVGTGGTVRNLAKVDRRMRGDYPITRLHAYVLDRRRLDGVAALVSGTPASGRATIPGLNSDRADSIVGGALAVQAVMDRLLATELTVAGYGLREGVALKSVTEDAASVEQVQSVALSGLGDRFTAYDPVRAELRTHLARKIMIQLRPGSSAEVMLAVHSAARLLDIGASIDYYRRHTHSARIVCDANLDGFSHRSLALSAAAIYAVGEREATVKGYAPLLTSADQPIVEQIAAAVALADALVRYGSVDPETISLERLNSHVVLATSVVDAWPLQAPTRRAERAFGASIERIGDSVHID
jgi:exopolyphosphatase / guanosine-5'-triphosphate,3'-diphosphate pyrophosphatase